MNHCDDSKIVELSGKINFIFEKGRSYSRIELYTADKRFLVANETNLNSGATVSSVDRMESGFRSSAGKYLVRSTTIKIAILVLDLDKISDIRALTATFQKRNVDKGNVSYH